MPSSFKYSLKFSLAWYLGCDGYSLFCYAVLLAIRPAVCKDCLEYLPGKCSLEKNIK